MVRAAVTGFEHVADEAFAAQDACCGRAPARSRHPDIVAIITMPATENSDVAFESVADQLFAVVAASPRWQARRTSLSATDS